MYKLNGEDILKIYKISIFILMIMIFSVVFAFAEDANLTVSDLGVTDDAVISEGESASMEIYRLNFQQECLEM